MSMLGKLRSWLRMGSLDRGDFSDAAERPESNVDAMAAAWHGGEEKAGHDLGGDANAPPGYVKAHDEGRPRH
jgi:hypothetical protein